MTHASNNPSWSDANLRVQWNPMRSVFAALVLGTVASAQSGAPWGIPNSERLLVPAVQREMRAAWVATVWNIDWPTTRNNVTSQRTQMNAILDAVAALRMNALFLQVRSQADAMYPSTIEPWSYFLTGRMNRVPTPSTYDPLQEWITGARSRGIELHAWVNPYRALVQTPGAGDAGFISPNHVSESTNPLASVVKTYGTQKWLDPGAPAAVSHSVSVIMDLVNRYDLDGLVFDDYFYPYPITNVAFPDSDTFAAHGSGMTLSNWRRKNVNDFVYQVYSNIKAAKPWVKFGIGPFGIWRPGNPVGVTGLDSFSSLYADSKLWWNNGWVDYLAPQLYWKISAPQQSYTALLSWWSQQNTQGRHLWPSNFTSKLDGTAEGWEAQEILDQIVATRNQAGATGNVHYSIKALRDNWEGVRTSLTNGLYGQDALIPASPWLDAIPPARPNLSLSVSGNNMNFSWTEGSGEAARYFVIASYRTAWEYDVVPAATLSRSLSMKSASGSLKAFAVAGVDRLGNVSTYASRTFDPALLSGGTSR